MNSRPSDFDNFYEDRVEAHRQLYSRERVWDRISQPSVVVSILILLITVVYNTYGSTATVDGTISLLRDCLWDGLVFVVPARLLNALDSWLDPSASSQSMLQPHESSHAAKSDTMRRVLGLDRSDGMMASVFKARTRAFSMTGGVLGLKLNSDSPPGLGNRDNSCYQNSILQGLASLKPLPEYLAYYLKHSDIEDGSRDVAQTLRSLISDLNDASNNGKTLWTPSLLKSMSTWTQQDAQEYYSKILDDIDKSIAKAVKIAERRAGFEATDTSKDEMDASQHSEDSGYQSLPSPKTSGLRVPRNPLEGLLAQRVACVQCGHSDGLSMIPFTCLTLSLGLHKAQHDLYERLDAYSKVESIENVECAKCTLLKAQRLLSRLVEELRKGNSTQEQLVEPLRRLEAVELALEEEEFDEKTLSEKCKITTQSKVSTTKTKQIVVARPPQSLAVHVNRSVFDPTTFNMIKNSAPVNFPRTLDLGPWCLGSAGESTPTICEAEKMNYIEEEEEQWSINPRASMIAGDVQPSKLTGPIYELRAVVTHYGRHDNGHYICYRKCPHHSPPAQVLPDDVTAAFLETDQDWRGQTPAQSADSDDDKAQGTDGPEEAGWDWWRLSDDNVSKVNEETVLSLSPGVFMLFYDCVEPNMMLSSENAEMQDTYEPALPGAVSETSGDANAPSKDCNPDKTDGSTRSLERPNDNNTSGTDTGVLPWGAETADGNIKTAPSIEEVTEEVMVGRLGT